MKIRTGIKVSIFLAALLAVFAMMLVYTERSFAAEMIPEVQVIVKAPAAGTTSSAKPFISVPTGKNYEVEFESWLDDDGNENPPEFTFTGGKQYTILTTIKSASGFHFADDVKAYITGGTLKENPTVYPYQFDDSTAVVMYINVTCAAAAKKANPLAVSGKTASIAYSKLKKAAQSLGVTKVLSISKAQGTKSFSKVSGSSKITINKSTGKVTVKKGLKKGTYKVAVKVTAAGNSSYKKGTKKATFTIKVK